MANELQSLDVTKLVFYTEKIKEIGELNKMMAPQYLRDFINAMDLTSTMLSKATKSNLDAKSALDKAKAIAYLDRSEEYCKEKGIKMSNGIREAYVDLDEAASTRVADYLTGVCYTVGAKAELITPQLVLYVPNTVGVERPGRRNY